MSATAVFNLMSLACARSGHYKVVTDMFERSLRFCPKVSSLPIPCNLCCGPVSFFQKPTLPVKFFNQEDHVWSGLALSLACEGRHLRALVLLREVQHFIVFGHLQVSVRQQNICRWPSNDLTTPQLVCWQLGFAMKSLTCSQRELPGQSGPSLGIVRYFLFVGYK